MHFCTNYLNTDILLLEKIFSTRKYFSRRKFSPKSGTEIGLLVPQLVFEVKNRRRELEEKKKRRRREEDEKKRRKGKDKKRKKKMRREREEKKRNTRKYTFAQII